MSNSKDSTELATDITIAVLNKLELGQLHSRSGEHGSFLKLLQDIYKTAQQMIQGED